MSSQLSAHAITAHTAMTRISVSRCSTLPAHRGSARAEKCSTSFSTDITTLPSLIKGEPAQPVSPSEPARPFHASPLEVSAYRLRHAHASHSLDRGAPIHLVQQTLGHASVATTGRYLNARPTDSSARYLASNTGAAWP